MTLSEKDLRSLQSNRIDRVRKHINDTWSGVSKYEAYVYLFEHMLDDVRKDFMTGVTYYRDVHGEQVPVENDIDVLRSFAHSCGLADTKLNGHLMRWMKCLPKSWLIDIPAWDLNDRLRTLCFGTQLENLGQECLYQHLLAWGAGLFARAANPSHQNHVIIFRGDQGIGKDFFVKTICKGLGPYFGTWTNTRDEREIIMLMERSLVLNIPEFDNTHQNETAMLKALITKYQATFRSPYARKAQTVELRTSFISSANPEYLLRDSTGNRRYLIFVTKAFDLIDKFDSFDSLQILAQFKYAYESKFKMHNVHKHAMDVYIGSQTPPPLDEQLIEVWNDEFKTLQKLGGTFSEWLTGRQCQHVLEKIRKDFGLGRNHMYVLLNNRKCRKRNENGMLYRAWSPLAVVREPGADQ